MLGKKEIMKEKKLEKNLDAKQKKTEKKKKKMTRSD